MIAALVSLCAAVLAAPSGEIAFVAAPGSGPARVHVVSIESKGVRAIGPEGAVGLPAWSPGGERLALAAQVPGGVSIYIANADGTAGRFLDHAQPNNVGPVWSPGGTQIAYTAGTGLDAQVMVTAMETGEERPWGGGRTSIMGPVWTTQTIVNALYERIAEDSTPRLLPRLPTGVPSPPVILAIGFVGDAAARTTALFLLSESEAIALDPELMPSPGAYEESAVSVSKEGIAFDSNDGGDREIFVIGRRRSWDLSNHAAADWRPVWSPDANWIAFESFRGGARGIYRCRRQSSRVYKVAANPAADCWGAAWSPDGKWIAYTTDADGAPAVWIIGAGGEDRARVSAEGLSAGHAAWRPAP